MNEVFEALFYLIDYIKFDTCYNKDFLIKKIDIIKQYILKAQEQEKENAYIEKIKTMMKQKDCALRYIESEDCFAVKTILSDGWYKLTPQFVDDNICEEIKPLPTIEKIKELKEKQAEYKKVLEIIEKKCLYTDNLNEVATCLNYDDYKTRMSKKYDTKVVKTDWNDKTLLDYLKLLTQDEFDLLKRWTDGKSIRCTR